MTKFIVRLISPKSAIHVMPTIFQDVPPVRNTIIVNPPMRHELQARRKEGKNQLLVYQTTPTNFSLLEALKRTNEECVVYGYRRQGRDGNLLFKNFSDKGFAEDLLTAKGVIANGGANLMAECHHLNKPLFTIPVKNRFEQVMNAVSLQKRNWGIAVKEATPQNILSFVNRLDEYRDALPNKSPGQGKDFYKALDGVLEKYL